MILAEFLDVIADDSVLSIFYQTSNKGVDRLKSRAMDIPVRFIKKRVEYIEPDYGTGDYYIYLKGAINRK